MPTITATTATKTSNPRFDLPVLRPLPSLTAGTDIPPPPDSPIEEKVPDQFPKNEVEETSIAATGTPNGNGTVNGNDEAVANSKSAYTGRGRTTVNHAPGSPTSSMRPGSIRRFLSRKSMYSSYTAGTNGNTPSENLSQDRIGFRPESPSTFSTMTSRKRSSSWFRRFTSGGSLEPPTKRTSIVYEETTRGPPPPQLPELAKNDEGSLGAEDMFKKFE